MGKQQTKRRNKKYKAGSAYAGHVRPTGILGFLSSANLIKFIFIGMALALAIGGAATIFGGNVFRRSSNHSSFVEPSSSSVDEAPIVESGFEPRRYATAPELTIDPNATYTATIRTADGDIVIELLPDQALQTVNNFVFLAQDGFYDGLTFHYVSSGFSATAGDPACSVDAPPGLCRGDGGPGYEIEDDTTGEFSAGTLGMANGSQFFIALTDSDQFEGFASFGTVTSGLDVAERLVTNTQIDSIEILIQ